MDPHSFSKHYSDRSFWEKTGKYAKKIGRDLVYRALLLFYAANRPNVPVWVRTTLYGALGYFILPLDIIPDFIPVVGYSDDFGVLAAAMATCAIYINDDVRRAAKNKLRDWFGDEGIVETFDV